MISRSHALALLLALSTCAAACKMEPSEDEDDGTGASGSGGQGAAGAGQGGASSGPGGGSSGSGNTGGASSGPGGASGGSAGAAGADAGGGGGTGGASSVLDGGIPDSDMRADGAVFEGDAAVGAIGAGSCCAEHDTPGCSNADLQLCVCEMVPSCCTEAWNAPCVLFVKQKYCQPGVRDCVCGDGDGQWQQHSCCDLEWTDTFCDQVAEDKCGAVPGCM